MPWSNAPVSARRRRLPRNWDKLRRAVLERDGYRCVAIRADTGKRCNAYATDCDHKEAMTDDDRMEAMQSLCKHHHDQKTAGEGGRANAQKRKKAAARHPGIIP